MVYSSHRARIGSIPGISLESQAKEDVLIDRLRSMTIPEEGLQTNASFFVPDVIPTRHAGPTPTKPANERPGKSSIPAPDFNGLGTSAENVRKNIHTLRKDLSDLRKLQLDLSRSLKADTQKKLLEFRKKASKVEDTTLNRVVGFGDIDAYEKKNPVRKERHQLSKDQKEYEEIMNSTERQLKELEVHMELIRINVVQTKRIEYPSQLEDFREELKTIVHSVTEVKNKFYNIEGPLRRTMERELELIQQEERLLKEEPMKIDGLITRCKKLSGTLETLKKLASMQTEVSQQSNSSKSNKKQR